MWIGIFVLTALSTELSAYIVSVDTGEQFSCTKANFTFLPTNCYINSNEWKGQKNVTSSGLPCQPWADNSPHPHENHGDDLFPDNTESEASNFCRDPNSRGAPWCYTIDSNTEWEFCNVPKCVGDVNIEEDVCTQCMCSFLSNYEVVEVECHPIVCPTCPGKIVDDGSCCGLCDLSVCVVDGVEYNNGEELPSDNPCQTCHCFADGTEIRQTCYEMACALCHGRREVDGTCCGSCTEGCMINDTLYEDGEAFQDGCSFCQCLVTENGPAIQCVGTPCFIGCDVRLMQMNEGDCCPSCQPGCYDNVTDAIYMKDEEVPQESNCRTCHCRGDDFGFYSIECETFACLPCVGRVEHDGSCCGVCHMDGCLYNDQHYNDGDEVPQDDPCKSCWCYNNGSVSELLCAYIACDCPGRVIPDDTCCGICEPGCFEDTQFYSEGETIPSDNPCVSKSCHEGKVVESVMMCEPCQGRWTSDGTCCGVCEFGCFVDENFYNDGDQFAMEDPCQMGYCHLGQVVLAMMACEECPGKWTDDGTCCGHCEPGCMVDGQLYENGADVPMADPCSFGLCENGELMIALMGCPPCFGSYIQDDTCCGQCVHTTVGPPVSTVEILPIQTTTEPVCNPSQCPKLPCSKSLQFQTDDMCCPQCKCRKRRSKYLPGIVGDKCDGCVCDGNTGKISCTPPTCTATIECVDPVKGDDCCYSCPNGKTCLVPGKKPKVLAYGDFYRTKKTVCFCGGDPWYPYSFCADTKIDKKTFKDILPFFPDGTLDLGKNED